jgi:predicted nucleic acid-binding protein
MMRKAVLADTGPVYALADGDDQYHDRAIKELKLLQQGNYQILLLQPTIMEAYTLVMRYMGLVFAHEWLSSITEGCGLVNPTPDDYANAWKIVSRYSDQKITLFDTAIATVSARLQIPVWSFDSDFDVMGTTVWRGLAG